MEYRKTVLPMDPVKKNKLKVMTIERSVPEEHMYVLVDRIIGDWIQKREGAKGPKYIRTIREYIDPPKEKSKTRRRRAKKN